MGRLRRIFRHNTNNKIKQASRSESAEIILSNCSAQVPGSA